MSPEQLNSRSGPEKGYLGTAVDVWASGVWLTVMLVRHSSACDDAQDHMHMLKHCKYCANPKLTLCQATLFGS